MSHTFNPALVGRGRKISEFEASLFYKSKFKTSQDYTEKPCLEKLKGRWGTGRAGKIVLGYLAAHLEDLCSFPNTYKVVHNLDPRI